MPRSRRKPTRRSLPPVVLVWGARCAFVDDCTAAFAGIGERQLCGGPVHCQQGATCQVRHGAQSGNSDCGPSDQQAIRQLRARLRLMGSGSERPSGYIHLTCRRTIQSRIAVIDFALLKQLVTSIFVIQPQSTDSSMRGSAQRPLLDTTPHQRA